MTAAIASALEDLGAGAAVWDRLTVLQRAALLDRLHTTVTDAAEEWALTAAASKGLDAAHPLRGEEWFSGPYAVLVALDAFRTTLRRIAAGGGPLDGVPVTPAPGGRLRAQVFPQARMDGILLSGYTGEVWFAPGTTEDDVRRDAGRAQRSTTGGAGIGVVLGAGNVTAIPVLDVLTELLAHGRVTALKVNPTQDPLVPVLERALAPLIGPGFLRILTGGGDVGAALARADGVAHVHITGAAATFRAVAAGLDVPITAELGGVSPVIVVPGEWSRADLRFHAEHVATMRLHNSGHNCIAAQMVVLSADWPQREEFLVELRRALATAPGRPVWYPRSDERLAEAAADHPDARWFADGTRALVEIDAEGEADGVERTEYFAPVLGVATLAGTGRAFLDAAVAYANDRLEGTLGANVLVDPVTEAALGAGFDEALAELRYGAVAVNAWTAFVFLTPTLTWGGFPGATVDDIQSGIGQVHNALLLEHVERSVARGPFRPFPRSLDPAGLRASRGRSLSLLPLPPWFVTSRTGAAVSEGFTRFRMDGRMPPLAATLARAFRA